MHYLAACCMVKNEERMILEWMSFHRAVGFDHLVIVDNGSTDRTAEIVRGFGDPGAVTLIDWPDAGGQLEIYSNIATRFRDRFRWCAFIDADEFLFSADGDLKEIVSRFEDCSAIGVHWLIYGSAGHVRTQPGFVTETFTRRAETGFAVNRHIKCIVRLADYMHPETAHYFATTGALVDEHRHPVPNVAPHGYVADREPSCDLLRINHYYVRAREDFERKARRGFLAQPDYLGADWTAKMAMFDHHDRNEVDDPAALRFNRLMRFYAELPPPPGVRPAPAPPEQPALPPPAAPRPETLLDLVRQPAPVATPVAAASAGLFGRLRRVMRSDP